MKEVNPNEALKLLQDDPKTVYLDVRSVPEFEQGHPIRAMNIPLLHFQPGMGMMPNEQFASVVEANLSKDTKILVGCKSGGRSAKACEILTQIGYLDVSNVSAGFVGAMDAVGRVVEPGWSLLKLPLCPGCEERSDYKSLAARINR